MRRKVIGFFHRLAYALALALGVFSLTVLPLGLPSSNWIPWALAAVNSPVSLVSLLVPCSERGLDFPLGDCHHEGGQTASEFFFSHLRLAVPVYLLIFYLPGFFVAARRWWRGRKAPKRSVATLLALAFVAFPAFSAHRGPSTPEERSESIRLVRALEADPLSEDAKKSRRWLVEWLSEIPDISVQMCPALLGANFEVNKKYAAELALQQSLSSAAFIIEHPDRANDKLAVSIAGVEGVFKAYEAILTQKPKAHFKSLDALLEARSKGTLESIVAQNMKACT